MSIMIQSRPATPEDSEFLYNLKKITLKEYIEQVWGWDEKFQRNLHQKRFDSEKYRIIQDKGKDIGCLSVEKHPDKLFLSIIKILPGYQNKGIGSSLIRNLIQKGIQEEKNVELQVLKVNRKAIKDVNTRYRIVAGLSIFPMSCARACMRSCPSLVERAQIFIQTWKCMHTHANSFANLKYPGQSYEKL